MRLSDVLEMGAFVGIDPESDVRGAQRGKASIILNPADPPLIARREQSPILVCLGGGAAFANEHTV